MDERRLLKLSARQLGLVTARQCLDHAVSRRVQRLRVASGDWRRIHPGVFKIGTAPPSVDERERAALLYAGSEAVLSHFSAGRRHGLDLPSSSWICLTISNRRRLAGVPGIKTWRSRRLGPMEIIRRPPVPMTSILRTLQDLATILDDRWLRAAVDSAVRTELIDLAGLRHFLEKDWKGCRGARKLRRLLSEYSQHAEATDSALESFALELFRTLKAQPVLHLPISDGAAFAVEVDLAWPTHRLCLELDGWRYHGSRRAFRNDRARDRKLAALGWTVLRYDWAEVCNHPRRVADEVAPWLNRPPPHGQSNF